MGWVFENYCYLCSPFIGSGGGIGRHAGLKIPWAEMPVRVRFPSRAPMKHAEIAQLVEHDLAKVGVASSSLVFRSPKASEKSGAFLFVSIPFLPSIHYICVMTFFVNI